MAFLDLTTFTEVDPNSKITVTSSKSDVAALDIADSARVYSDRGAAHFSANYEHLWEASVSASTAAGEGGIGWALSNITSMSVSGSDTNNRVRLSNEGTFRVLLQEDNGLFQDFDDGHSFNTVYYMKTSRDESVGSFGTIYNYVYSDSGRTTLVSSQTVTLHNTKTDYQYLYVTAGKQSGSGSTMTYFTQNFDLQESAGTNTRGAFLAFM